MTSSSIAPAQFLALTALACIPLVGCAGRDLGMDPGGTGGGGPQGWAPTPDLPCEQGERYHDDTRACYCVADDTWTCVDGSNPFGDEGIFGTSLVRRFDFLFVVDDSPGMAGAQRRLAEAMDAFTARLEAHDMDYTVSFVTPGGGPGQACPATEVTAPEPVTTSCRERLQDFVPGPGAPADPARTCTDLCELESLTLTPGEGASGRDLLALTRRAGVLNTDATADPAQALRCMAPQGNAGCDYAQPLATLASLEDLWSETLHFFPGLMTPSAGLGTVILTDGVDCSVQDPSIFDPAGARTFWSDPQGSAPSPAVCWNAGVSCSGGPGTYDACAPADLDALGEPASVADASLIPVASVAGPAGHVGSAEAKEFLVLGGVPVGYPEVDLAYADASDPDEQATYGIGPGCARDDTRAQPPARLLAAAEQWSQGGVSTVASVCEDDLSGRLVDMVDRMAPLRTTCMTAKLADVDPTRPGLQPLCFFEARLTSDQKDPNTSVPTCLETEDGGWDFPSPEADMCVRFFVDDEVPTRCSEWLPPEFAQAFRVERRPGADYDWSAEAFIWCLLDREE